MEAGRSKKQVHKSRKVHKSKAHKSRKVHKSKARTSRKVHKSKARRSRRVRGGESAVKNEDCSERSWGTFLTMGKKNCTGQVDGKKIRQE